MERMEIEAGVGNRGEPLWIPKFALSWDSGKSAHEPLPHFLLSSGVQPSPRSPPPMSTLSLALGQFG